MHIPSERVYKEMRAASASLWIVPANGGDELALLIKAPTSAIKALIAGCQLSLLFGRAGSHLCAGVRIFDIPDAAMLISGVQRQEEEHETLHRLLRERRTPVFLFNEMDACLAWTNLEISDSHATRVVELVGQKPRLYRGPFTLECSRALDCFCQSVDPTQPFPTASTIPLVHVEAVLEPWRIVHVSFVGLNGYQTITIGDPDEGEMLERAIWASLESVFPLRLFKSPQVVVGKKTRELTDVLAFHEHGSFLIEAKDLSIIQAGYERDQNRRTRTVQKQIKKAINQLIGGCRSIARGDPVIDGSGKQLNIVRDQPPHCLVLITELMHWGDWGQIETQLIEAMQSTGALFHLFDLREFITLLKGSAGDARLLDYNLVGRCKLFAEKRSVHIRSRMG